MKNLSQNTAFVVYYHKNNIYSFNALIGALETDSYFNQFAIYFITKRDELIHDMKDIINKHKLVVVGISFFTTQLWEIYDLITLLKKKYSKNIIYLAGGPHPTGDPLGTLKLGFDVVVVGEGEETLIEFLKNIDKRKKFKNIKGIAYFDELNEYVFTGNRTPINLDDYPPFPLKNAKSGAIEITRGCPYICYFCQTPFISGIAPRHRAINIICKYVQELKSHYGDFTDVRFISPNAFSYGSIDGKNLNLEKLEELLLRIREIIGKKGRIFLGTFPSEVRPEHVSKETIDLVLKYANNDNITIGAQSGSQKILDICHRGHTIKDIYNAVNLTLDSNLKANVDFILGLPEEKDEDIELSIEVMLDLIKLGARIHAHSFIPLPQTPFSKKVAKQIDVKYQDIIKLLTSRGFAFGDWKKQEQMAIRITKYLKSKKLR
ncbi:MAG: TIGR04013 family B12-binding domain/radical SAM domain-containing protein [Promethearchaeota archaeon]